MHDDDVFSNPRAGENCTLERLITRRLSRRHLLKGSLVTAAGLGVPLSSGCAGAGPELESGTPRGRYGFQEVERGSDQTAHVAAGHDLEVLLRWGDPLFPDAPEFDPQDQSAAAQALQFGYNCDFIGFLPIAPEQDGAPRGLLCVNHEYTSTQLMLPGIAATYPESMTADKCALEMAAHGGTVVEIKQVEGRWQVVLNSGYNRRIMAHQTPMTYRGPAAGSSRLAIAADPEGKHVEGTLNNCAGGMTPWGTYLMAEENFHGYFLGEVGKEHTESTNHERYGVPGGWYQWGRYRDEFNLSREPNGPNRYGWVVEVDVLDPQSTPVKRTALGRFKHEGAETVLAPDGRVVLYMGDDERFEYVYKFVTEGQYQPENRAANLNLLDAGTLFVARFNANGTLNWMPLRYGEGPLTEANGFTSQADVVIEARRAADLLGATPMDRPEDVEAQPQTGKAYIMLTNNTRRAADDVDAANPRAHNAYGHIVEITSPDGDHAAEHARWDVLVLCGDPDNPEVGAAWNSQTSANGWFGSPDNCAFDPAGRLWVATDGNPATGAADGLWGVETQGPQRGTGYAFFRAPVGAEVCGPRFTPDGKTLFLSVQHPGDGEGATFENPMTRWPDANLTVPPRPSVVAIYHAGGRAIGS